MGKASSLPNAADSDEYTVGPLVDVRGIQWKERYLVKWSGYPYEECAWEQKTNFTSPVYVSTRNTIGRQNFCIGSSGGLLFWIHLMCLCQPFLWRPHSDLG
jgi:hypothetical protein